VAGKRRCEEAEAGGGAASAGWWEVYAASAQSQPSGGAVAVVCGYKVVAARHGMKRRAAVARRAAAWDAHPAPPKSPPNRLRPLLFLIQRASLPLDLIAYEKYPLTLADHCSLQVIAFLHPV
jgi:hypothetical protein